MKVFESKFWVLTEFIYVFGDKMMFCLLSASLNYDEIDIFLLLSFLCSTSSAKSKGTTLNLSLEKDKRLLRLNVFSLGLSFSNLKV